MSAIDFSRPVLVLEASTASGGVALLRPGREARSRAVRLGAGAADTLFPAILALLAESSCVPADLGAVCCGEGPGSFTSLRIAAALAKGLAHGARIPLYAFPSLVLGVASLPPDSAPGTYLAHADALRGERYVQEVALDATGGATAQGPAVRRGVDDLAGDHGMPLVAIGGAPSSWPSPRQVESDVSCIARVLGAWRDAPVPLATWEPLYGRLAEAQVKWEAQHGRALSDGST